MVIGMFPARAYAQWDDSNKESELTTALRAPTGTEDCRPDDNDNDSAAVLALLAHRQCVVEGLERLLNTADKLRCYLMKEMVCTQPMVAFSGAAPSVVWAITQR